jgi:hypothetical protein
MSYVSNECHTLHTLRLSATTLAATTGYIRRSIGLVLGLSLTSVVNVTLSQSTSRRSILGHPAATALSDDRVLAYDYPSSIPSSAPETLRAQTIGLADSWFLQYVIVADADLYSHDQLKSKITTAHNSESLINEFRVTDPSLSGVEAQGIVSFLREPTAAPTAAPTVAPPASLADIPSKNPTIKPTGPTAAPVISVSSASFLATYQWLFVGLGVRVFAGIVIGLLICVCRYNLKCCKSCVPGHTGIEV